MGEPPFFDAIRFWQGGMPLLLPFMITFSVGGKNLFQGAFINGGPAWQRECRIDRQRREEKKAAGLAAYRPPID